MKTSRFLCVLMALMLLCGAAMAEAPTVSMLAMNSWYSTVDLSNAELLNDVADLAGVKIDWNLIDPTVYADSVSPMLASGQDLPDIIQLPDTDNNMVYLSSGMFVQLDKYFDIMPNYTKFLEENPVIKGSLTAPDGHIYYVPQTAVADSYQPVIMYNMLWLEKAGKEVPTTLDEFVDLIRYYKENDMNGNGDANDEIPMSIQSAFLPYMFAPAFGMDLVSGFYADDNGVVQYAPITENYRRYLTFLNGLYNEGLLEIEFTSLNRDQITARCASDTTGVTYDFSWQMSNLYSANHPAYNGTEGVFVGQRPLSGEHEGFFVGRNAVSGIFGVNVNAKDVETAVKALDVFMSEAAQDLYVWGKEGLTYEVVDGQRKYLPKCTEDAIWYQGLGINAPCMPSQQSASATAVLLPAWHVQAIADNEVPYAHIPFPSVYSTEDEASVLNMYMVDVQTYADERAVGFISGIYSIENEFDSYVATLKNMQIDELIKVKQAQYDRFAAALN